MDLADIDTLVLDVDGVLTGGTVIYDDDQNRVMAFHIHDGSAVKRWRSAGRRVGLLSGRRSGIVRRRAVELGIDSVHQGVEDKGVGLGALLRSLGSTEAATCYVGDDLADVEPLRACGFGVAVANAVPTLKRCADYVTRHAGGAGAVAEVIELLLRAKDRRATPATKR